MSLLEENTEILAKMERDGSDLGPSRSVDFSQVFPDRTSAETFAAEWESAGFKVDLVETERDEDPWDVTVSVEMQPSASNITLWEERFNARAKAHGDRADGWGFFRV